MAKATLIICTALILLFPNPGFPVAEGDVPPPFTLKHMVTGEDVSLEQFEGKVVYLDFWASWCAPCLRSFPYMNSLQENYGEQGLVVIAVNLDQKPGDAKEFLEENPTSFIVVENRAGDVAELYDVIAMPSTYIIGRNGKVEQVHHGFKSENEAAIRDSIVELL